MKSFKELINENTWVVTHDGHDDPKYAHVNKKHVVNHITKYPLSAASRLRHLKKLGFKNVQVKSYRQHLVDKLTK